MKGIITLGSFSETPTTISFEDFGHKVEYHPMYVNDEFSGFYLPVIDDVRTFPVTKDYTLIRSEYVCDIVEEALKSMNITVTDAKYKNYYNYHYIQLFTNLEDVVDENPFENTLMDMGIDLKEIFDYTPDNPVIETNEDGDVIGTCIEITNSYCGLSQLFMTYKIVRFVCGNGLVVGKEAYKFKIKHNMNESMVEKEIVEHIKCLVKEMIDTKMTFISKLRNEIPIYDAIKILESAKKYGVSTRYINKLNEIVMEKLSERVKTIQLWWLWNFLTYNIERNKTLANIPLRRYNSYVKLMNDLL